MNKRSLSAVGLACGIVAIAGSVWLELNDGGPEVTRGPAQPASAIQQAPAPTAAPSVQSSAARLDNVELAERVAALQRSLEALEQAQRLAADKTSAEAARADMPLEQQIEAERVFEERYLAQLDRDFHVAAGEPWTQEAKDEAWNVAELLANGEGALEVECGAALCRAFVTHAGDGSHAQLLARASEQLDWAGAAYVTHARAGGAEQSVIYLAKPGAELPHPEHSL